MSQSMGQPASQIFDYPAHSKAAVFQEAGKPIQLIDCLVPALRPGESLLKVEVATICASDLHSFFGRRHCDANTILGHEVVGTIVAQNPEVSKVEPHDSVSLVDEVAFESWLGQRCVIAVPVSACTKLDFSKQCRFCQRGLAQKCVGGIKYGHCAEGVQSNFLNGSLSQYMILKRGTFVYPVGQGIAGPLVAMSTCATATAMAAIRMSDLPAAEFKPSIAILGAGALGLFVAVALMADGYPVVLADTNGQRCELALEIVQRMSSEPQVSGSCQIMQVGNSLSDQLRHHFRDGIDVTFELSGQRQCVIDAIENSSIGGSVMLVGTVRPVDDIPFSADFVTRGLRKVIGVHNYVNADLKAAVQWLQRTHHWLQPIVGTIPCYELNDIQAAFEYAERVRPIRVAIVPNP